MYYYKYIFYRIYSYLKEGNWALYPHIETILILTILPVFNLLLILYLLSLLNLYVINFGFINSHTSKLLIVVFAVIFVFNNLYFFFVSNWKEIIISFRKQRKLSGIDKILYLYVLFSIVSLSTVYLTGGLFIK